MNQAADQYLRLVKKNLRCPHSLKAEFLHQLEDEVFLYSEDNEAVDCSDLSQRFGTPESVAAEFLNNLDGNAVAKSQYHRNKVFLIAIVTLITLAMIIGVHKLYVQHTILDIEYVESITYEDNHPSNITDPTFFHMEGTAK